MFDEFGVRMHACFKKNKTSAPHHSHCIAIPSQSIDYKVKQSKGMFNLL